MNNTLRSFSSPKRLAFCVLLKRLSGAENPRLSDSRYLEERRMQVITHFGLTCNQQLQPAAWTSRTLNLKEVIHSRTEMPAIVRLCLSAGPGLPRSAEDGQDRRFRVGGFGPQIVMRTGDRVWSTYQLTVGSRAPVLESNVSRNQRYFLWSSLGRNHSVKPWVTSIQTYCRVRHEQAATAPEQNGSSADKSAPH